MAVPTDPLMSNQWYLDQPSPSLYDLNITGAWAAGFTGAGIRTLIIDNGFDFTHTDLNPNYDQTLDYDFESNTANAFGFSTQGHGTAVAGILGADNNGSGIVGVAFDTSMVGYRTVDLINNSWLEDVRDALHHAQASAQAQVVNMSQGMSNAVGTVLGAALDQSIVAQIRTEIGDAVTLGRGGLGILLAKSAGNARATNYDVNADMWTNDTRQVVVGAVDDDGNVSSYSSYGAALLVSAFGGPSGDIYTTDRVGSAGYTGGDFTGFNGTSAATPMVAGIMAIMLDANVGLGWRDVQDILAGTARHVGSAVGGSASGFERDAWAWNGAEKWNGGGMHFSNDYGYGLVDATAASRLAETWFHGGFTAHTSANQSSTVEDDFTGPGVVIGGGVGNTFNIGETTSIEVERVRLTVTFSTTYIEDVEIYLTSPDGTRSILINDIVQGQSPQSNDFNGTWVFESQEFRGELSSGTWTVQIIDDFQASDPTTVTNIQLETFGHAPSTADRYLFTNEYSDLFGLGGHSVNITDLDGGVDTVNAAPVTAAMTIRLTNGQSSTIDGVSVRLNNMEHAVGGDGGDVIVGNNSANWLYGMRGADQLFGGEGNDILYGGAGGDVLNGGNGSDTAAYNTSTAGVKINLATGAGLGGDAGGDSFSLVESLIGSAQADTLIGSAAANVLVGGFGRDVHTGAGGADRFDFNNIAETGAATTTADWITDFTHLVDVIDVSTIDASVLLGGNNAFLWRGLGGFSTAADGELRYQQVDAAGTANDYTMVWGDVDADTGIEFAIRLAGVVTLSSADFVL